jgi:hypothetical protein
MTGIKNPMEIFKTLNKSNCRKCEELTCLAFAVAVFNGKRQIEECPELSPEVISQFGSKISLGNSLEKESEEIIKEMQKQIETINLNEAANRLGVTSKNGKLVLKILGKDFGVDAKGQFYTDIHVHPWIAVPVLRYILEGNGQSVTGNWVPLRELEGGKDWYRLFNQRCEKPLKKVADNYTDLFEDMVTIFNGKKATRHFESDISVVLHPLPLVPILVCYWKPEDGLEADLHLFFDDTAEANLHIEALYTLGTGLVLMLEKIAQRHG